MDGFVKRESLGVWKVSDLYLKEIRSTDPPLDLDPNTEQVFLEEKPRCSHIKRIERVPSGGWGQIVIKDEEWPRSVSSHCFVRKIEQIRFHPVGANLRQKQTGDGG